jgi:hypothetical protein
MAIANIWPVLDVAANGQPLGRLPGGTVVNVSYTATHNETAAFTDTAIVGFRIKVDTDSWFLCSTAGTVATSSNGIKMSAGDTEYFARGNASPVFSFVTA